MSLFKTSFRPLFSLGLKSRTSSAFPKAGLQEPPGIPCPPRAGLQPDVLSGSKRGMLLAHGPILPLGIHLTPSRTLTLY